MKHSRVPAEIDRLMWTIAEEGNAKARDEFDQRYPDYRLELVRRIGMVHDLKGGKPTRVESSVVPRFQPAPAAAPVNRRAVAWTGGLVLAALAVASYTVVSLTTSPPAKIAKPAPSKPVVKFATPVRPTPVAVEKPVTPKVEEPAPKPETPAYLIPQDLEIKRAPLQTVLTLLATQGGLKIDFDPGMPNPDVAISYHAKTVIEMLEDLGKQYAFTPFDQGNGSVIVVPIRSDSPDAKSEAPSKFTPNRPTGG